MEIVSRWGANTLTTKARKSLRWKVCQDLAASAGTSLPLGRHHHHHYHHHHHFHHRHLLPLLLLWHIAGGVDFCRYFPSFAYCLSFNGEDKLQPLPALSNRLEASEWQTGPGPLPSDVSHPSPRLVALLIREGQPRIVPKDWSIISAHCQSKNKQNWRQDLELQRARLSISFKICACVCVFVSFPSDPYEVGGKTQTGSMSRPAVWYDISIFGAAYASRSAHFFQRIQ